MTALDFPSSPTYGQTYSLYTWDGEKWYLTVGGTGIAAPFSPAALTGLKGWWDASVYASMSLTGSRILSVADQSGNGNTITAVNVDGPFYAATGFNTSYPYMNFSSAGRYGLIKTPFAMGTGNTLTAWYVGNFSDGGAIGASSNRVMAYVGGLHDYTAGSFCLNTTGFSTTTMNFTRSPGQVTYTGTAGNHRVIVTLASDGTGTMYIDGAAVGTAAMSGNWLDAGSMGIGISPTDACWWGGPIAEAGIATGFSNSTVVAQLDTYLKNKWGLTAKVLDGSAKSTFFFTNTGTVTLTTTRPNDVIVLIFYANTLSPNPARTVSSVTSSGLTWTRRSDNDYTSTGAGGLGTDRSSVEIWWAPASAALTSHVITVTTSGNVDNAYLHAFGVNNCTNIAAPWDTHASLATAVAATTNTNPLVVSGVSTDSTAPFMIIGSGAPSLYPYIGVSGFTQIQLSQDSSAAHYASLQSSYKQQTSAQSSASFSGDAGSPSSGIIVVDALA